MIMGNVETRVKMRIYPFTYAIYDDMKRVITSLTSYDRDTIGEIIRNYAKMKKKKVLRRKLGSQLSEVQGELISNPAKK